MVKEAASSEGEGGWQPAGPVGLRGGHHLLGDIWNSRLQQALHGQLLLHGEEADLPAHRLAATSVRHRRLRRQGEEEYQGRGLVHQLQQPAPRDREGRRRPAVLVLVRAPVRVVPEDRDQATQECSGERRLVEIRTAIGRHGSEELQQRRLGLVRDIQHPRRPAAAAQLESLNTSTHQQASAGYAAHTAAMTSKGSEVARTAWRTALAWSRTATLLSVSLWNSAVTAAPSLDLLCAANSVRERMLSSVRSAATHTFWCESPSRSTLRSTMASTIVPSIGSCDSGAIARSILCAMMSRS